MVKKVFAGPVTAWQEKFYLNQIIDSPGILHVLVNEEVDEMFVFYYGRDHAAIDYMAKKGCEWSALNGRFRLVEGPGRIVVGTQVIPKDARWGETTPTQYLVRNQQYVFSYNG